MIEVIKNAVVGIVLGLVEVFCKAGVNPDDVKAGIKAALDEITDIKAAEVAAFSKQWRIAKGLEPTDVENGK